MQKRSKKKEYIDEGLDSGIYTLKEYQDCLKKLGKIGDILGGNQATLSAFNKIQTSPQSILDVGCGGGFFTKVLATKYPLAKVTGVDYSAEAIQYAQKKLDESPQKLSNLNFQVPKTIELNSPPNSYDIVTCTLVCHHMSDDEIVDFLKRAKSVAKKYIIINDLHRHFLAFASFKMISSLIFRNRLISHDGLISIQRSFKKSDWINYLKKANFKKTQYKISWKWAFRWIIQIEI